MSKLGRKPDPVPPVYTRGWCVRCHDLSVRGDTGACTRCGAGLARGYSFVEADDEVLLAEGIIPEAVAAERRRVREKVAAAGQAEMVF